METEYRAWDGTKMIYDGDSISLPPTNNIIQRFEVTNKGVHYTIGEDRVSSPHKALMKSLGQTDKNDKMMFEGDILMPGKGEIFWDNSRSMFKIRWHDKMYKHIRTRHESEKDPLYVGSEPMITNKITLDVKGNIYENPDILK